MAVLRVAETTAVIEEVHGLCHLLVLLIRWELGLVERSRAGLDMNIVVTCTMLQDNEHDFFGCLASVYQTAQLREWTESLLHAEYLPIKQRS